MRSTIILFACLPAMALLSHCGSSGGEDYPATMPLGQCSANSDPFPVRPAPTVAASLPALHVSGAQLLDENGSPVALRGTNFGSWLLIEAWIPGFKVFFDDFEKGIADFQARADETGCGDAMSEGINQGMAAYLLGDENYLEIIEIVRQAGYENAATDAQKICLDDIWAWWDSQPWIHGEEDLWAYLYQRFGPKKMEELKQLYRDHWITETDFARVAQAGMNVIRLPIWYDVLESGEEGESHFRPAGWRRLDFAVEMARRYGLYLIVDLHGAPGGQSKEPHCGTSRGNRLWKEQACVDKTVRLWQALAAYLKDEPHVAAFDLLNEPMTLPDKATYASVLIDIYAAVRQENPSVIVMYEDGYKSPSSIPKPAELGFEQCMFSIHAYNSGSSAQAVAEAYEAELDKWSAWWQGDHGVPLYFGEFAQGGHEQKDLEAMDLILGRLNARGVHWSPWTFKYWSLDSYWGLYHHENPDFVPMDVTQLSFEELKARLLNLDSSHFIPHADFLEVVTRRATEPFGPAASPTGPGVGVRFKP